MAKESFILKMVLIIRELSRKAQLPVKAGIFITMAAFMKEEFIIIKHLAMERIMIRFKGIAIKAIGKMMYHQVMANKNSQMGHIMKAIFKME